MAHVILYLDSELDEMVAFWCFLVVSHPFYLP